MGADLHDPQIPVPETSGLYGTPETTTITLNFSIFFRIFAGIGGLLLISASILIITHAILNGAVTDLSTTSLLASQFGLGMFSLIFFGAAGVAWIWTLKYPPVTIKMNADGLLIFGYYVIAGFSKWDNLISPEIIRIQGIPYFAIRFKDVDAFLKGRDEFDDKFIRIQDRFRQRLMRVVLALIGLLPKKFVDLFFSLFGFAGAPESVDAKGMLKWNFDSFGYHLVIPYMLIRGGPRSLVQKIEDARRVYTGDQARDKAAIEGSTDT